MSVFLKILFFYSNNIYQQQQNQFIMAQQTNNFSKNITTKSFLQNRQSQRDKSAGFFRDNKIRTGSFVKEKGGDFVVVPFYDKRNTKIYPTKSQWVNSWNSTVHSNKGVQHAGIGMSKTLVGYHPDQKRNRLLVQDFIPPYRNTSVIELGDRNERDTKYWVTTYRNNHSGRPNNVNPTKNPAITAF